MTDPREVALKLMGIDRCCDHCKSWHQMGWTKAKGECMNLASTFGYTSHYGGKTCSYFDLRARSPEHG